MGTRVQIRLLSLLNEPRVKVELYEQKLDNQDEEIERTGVRHTYVSKAMVSFDHSSKFLRGFDEDVFDADFDVSVLDGEVFLETDFNIYRGHAHTQNLQQMLFECCIVHTVIPG